MRAFLKRLRESNDSLLWWKIRALTTLPGLLMVSFGVRNQALWAVAVVIFGVGLFGETILQLLWAYDSDQHEAEETSASHSSAEGHVRADAALDNRDELRKLDRNSTEN